MSPLLANASFGVLALMPPGWVFMQLVIASYAAGSALLYSWSFGVRG